MLPLLRPLPPQQGRRLRPQERGRGPWPQPQPRQRAPSCYSSFLRALAARQDRRFGGSPRRYSSGERREERGVAEAEAAKDSRQKQAAEVGLGRRRWQVGKCLVMHNVQLCKPLVVLA